MRLTFVLVTLLAALAASCSTGNKPKEKPPPPAAKKTSPFDGTTKALKEMRIPEIPSNQKFESFQPQKRREKEKPK